MFQLKEEAKGRPVRRKTAARSSSSKSVKPAVKSSVRTAVKSSAKTAVKKTDRPYKELKMGVRSSGYKVFKPKETMAGLEKKKEKAAKPAFKAKTFKPRFKKK